MKKSGLKYFSGFLPVFVVDMKINFVYNFGAP